MFFGMHNADDPRRDLISGTRFTEHPSDNLLGSSKYKACRTSYQSAPGGVVTFSGRAWFFLVTCHLLTAMVARPLVSVALYVRA